MLLSLSTEPVAPGMDAGNRQQLLAIARAAINGASSDEIVLAELPESLRSQGAVFVTLTLDGQLRGCIGSLVATMPLALAVDHAARNAAQRDPRFPPLQAEEAAATRIEISVLSELEHLAVESRRALLTTLRPGVDGLLLEDGHYRATFLPKVWGQLPEAEDFLAQLLAKAGLPAGYWSPSLRAHRYRTSVFADDVEHAAG